MIKENGGKAARSEGQVGITEADCGKAFPCYTKNSGKPMDDCEQEEMLPGLYFRMQKSETVASHAFIIHSFIYSLHQYISNTSYVLSHKLANDGAKSNGFCVPVSSPIKSFLLSNICFWKEAAGSLPLYFHVLEISALELCHNNAIFANLPIHLEVPRRHHTLRLYLHNIVYTQRSRPIWIYRKNVAEL